MIEVFTWFPRLNAEQEITFQTRTVQFGDGYKQVTGDGIHPRSQKWTMEFTGGESYINEIKSFLDRHGGYKSFQWTPPLEPLGLFRCSGYKPTALGNKKYNLSVTFEQAFAP